MKNKCTQKCFRKTGFLTDRSDLNSEENALTEVQDIFVGIDVDPEDFLHFDDQLETQKTNDSAISMIEGQSENDEENDNDENYEEPENHIKDNKTTITYLEELQKCSLTIFNSELLDLTSTVKEGVERVAFSNKKQKNNY